MSRTPHVHEATRQVGRMQLTTRGAIRWDWRDPYHLAVTVPWGGFVLLFLAAELAVNLLFATLYTLDPGAIANARPGSFVDAFFFSIETLSTVGYGVMAPVTLYGHLIVSIELVCGLSLTALVTGLLFVRFSRPRAKIAYADNAVICRYNGEPALMLRIANRRLTVLADARAHLSVLLVVRSREGHTFRRISDLPLVRAHLPLFALTWTLIHVIDAASPLHGLRPEDLIRDAARFFLGFAARDPSVGAEIHAMHDLGAENVLLGMRYVDAVTSTGSQVYADLTRLSLVEPDGVAHDETVTDA